MYNIYYYKKGYNSINYTSNRPILNTLLVIIGVVVFLTILFI